MGYPESSQRSSLDDFDEFVGTSLERSARRGTYGHHPFPSLYLPPAQEYGDVYPSLPESRDQVHDLSGRLVHRRPSVFDFEPETYRSQLGDDETQPPVGEDIYLSPLSEPVTQPVTSRNSLFPECLPSEGPMDVENRPHLAMTGLPHPDIFALGPPGASVRRRNTSPPLHTMDTETSVTYLPHPSLPSPERDLSIPSRGSRLSRERSMSTPVSHRPKKKSKMHECEICHKLFPRPSGLQTHMNTHTDSKPFPCTVQGCNKRFAVRSNAKRHLRTHGIIPSPPTNDPEPTPYIVDFNDPVVLPPSYSPQSQSLKGPTKLHWVPPSLATRTNVKSLRTCSEVDSESDDGGECFDRQNGVGSFAPALPMPLRTVVPTMPVGPHDEFFEERDSYLPAGSHPYHPTQFRGLPGPAPPMLQAAVY
ncbi:hypothetical protein CCMSSC00406_0005725 [Pleurotus cornucopiae]|uniref:Uncharacterized protein n=1 Tax=Pleurotus cornucopiae TaxID=5321 RepID=A0ACB7IUU7_PLECO|nr:hypothetical protein CCMSSC00406_0005725 [Pleurotus cornucopiae]